MFLNRLSERLTDCNYIPWRMRYLGGPLNTLVGVHFRRRKLKQLIAREYSTKPDDITVMICIKGRMDFRLENNLRSIRSQTYPKELIKIVVVDYDNHEEDAKKLRSLCEKFEAKIIRVTNRPVWNKSHAFNVALRHVETKFLMTNDADMILSQNYIEESIKSIKSKPLSLVLNVMLDLSEDSVEELELYAKNGHVPDTENLKSNTIKRKTYTDIVGADEMHIAIFVTYSIFCKIIRGYDEFYTFWGSEDNDMYRRLHYFGLETINLKNRAYYMHQWHPKYEGVQHPGLNEVIKKNRDYFNLNHSIIRNDNNWGESG